ncbi:unnamed protein product [Peniophora sp. CBMAI 1063]|nr:unnamed protein product [Peniophora sp. CBMAI 1063]
MHTLSHHAASRTRVHRHQPYSRPPIVPRIICTTSHGASLCTQASIATLAITPEQARAARNQLTFGLVDVAVYMLGNIWLTHTIPAVFATHVSKHVRSAHVSGPFVSPVYPHPPPSSTRLPSPPATPDDDGTAGDAFDEHDEATNTANLRGFVIEVLKRSRTTTWALQSALCYITAVRAKVAELTAAEAAGCGYCEADQSDRIVLAADIGFVEEYAEDVGVSPLPTRETRATPVELWQPGQPGDKLRTETLTLPPVPNLPSPLLDPRRTFIAALILASKFSQDKCYSNRAWAKLAGLPPREIGRCERALGDALGWRLWVGKAST